MIAVTHVIPGLESAGAENMLLKLLQHRSANTKHCVISLTETGPIGKKLIACGVPVKALGWRRGSLPGPFGITRLIGSIKESRPDVIQGWMYHGNLMASVARKFSGATASLLWSIRCSLNRELESRMTRHVIDLGARFSKGPSAIIYNSVRAQQEHERAGYAAARSLVIPNGFDTTAFARRPDRAALRREFGLPAEGVVVGHLARAHPVKDHLLFFEAARAVCNTLPDAHFIAAGAGVPALGRTGAEGAAVAALGNRLTLLDAISDIPAYMSALDLFVLSSKAEGFANVLGEAMSCEVPCVATAVGDCTDIVGDTGTIVPREDLASLSKAIFAMASLDDPARRARGAAARERIAERYALDAISARYETLWRSRAVSRQQPVATKRTPAEQ